MLLHMGRDKPAEVIWILFILFLLFFFSLLTWTWAWRLAPSLRRLGAQRVAAAPLLQLHFQCSCRRRRVVILVGELVFGVATACRFAEPASTRRLGRTRPPCWHRCRPPLPGPPAQCRLAEPWRASVGFVVVIVVHCCLACGLVVSCFGPCRRCRPCPCLPPCERLLMRIGSLVRRAESSSMSSWLALRRWRWHCRRLAGPLPCLPCVVALHVSSPWSVRRRASSCCHLATPVVAAGRSWFGLLPPWCCCCRALLLGC